MINIDQEVLSECMNSSLYLDDSVPSQSFMKNTGEWGQKTPDLQGGNRLGSDYVTLSDQKAFRTPGEGQNILSANQSRTRHNKNNQDVMIIQEEESQNQNLPDYLEIEGSLNMSCIDEEESSDIKHRLTSDFSRYKDLNKENFVSNFDSTFQKASQNSKSKFHKDSSEYGDCDEDFERQSKSLRSQSQQSSVKKQLKTVLNQQMFFNETFLIENNQAQQQEILNQSNSNDRQSVIKNQIEINQNPKISRKIIKINQDCAIENQPYSNLPLKQTRQLDPIKSPLRARIARLKDVTNIVNNQVIKRDSVTEKNIQQKSKMQFTFYQESLQQQAIQSQNNDQKNPLDQATTKAMVQDNLQNKLNSQMPNHAIRRSQIISKILSKSPNILQSITVMHNNSSSQDQNQMSSIERETKAALQNQASFSAQDNKFFKPRDFIPKPLYNQQQVLGLYGEQNNTISNKQNNIVSTRSTSIPPHLSRLPPQPENTMRNINRSSAQLNMASFQRRQTLNDTFSQERWKQQSLSNLQLSTNASVNRNQTSGNVNNIGSQQSSPQYGFAQYGLKQPVLQGNTNGQQTKIDIVEKIRISYELIQNKERQQSQTKLQLSQQTNQALVNETQSIFNKHPQQLSTRNSKARFVSQEMKENQQNSFGLLNINQNRKISDKQTKLYHISKAKITQLTNLNNQSSTQGIVKSNAVFDYQENIDPNVSRNAQYQSNSLMQSSNQNSKNQACFKLPSIISKQNSSNSFINQSKVIPSESNTNSSYQVTKRNASII
eukprot:403373477